MDYHPNEQALMVEHQFHLQPIWHARAIESVHGKLCGGLGGHRTQFIHTSMIISDYLLLSLCSKIVLAFYTK
jgi:hypothetical protein